MVGLSGQIGCRMPEDNRGTEPMKTSRRQFTTWGMAGGVAAVVGGMPTFALAKGAAVPAAEPWYHQIKRIGQTNFNERDPEFGDVELWADYWASARVQAVALSVSGPVAFYPTKVPFFHVSDYLKGRDLFGECAAAAKKRGIRVFGRMSPDIQFITPELLKAHPDWFRRDAGGKLQTPAPEIAFTCQFTRQFTEQQPAILREVTSRYDIDGVYMNGWPMLQECYCDACRKIGDPKSEAYRTALMDDAERLTDLYRGIVTAGKPGNFYSCNIVGGMEDSGLDQWKLTRKANWYTSDNQARASVDDPVWQDAQQVRYAHAMMGERPVAAVTGSYTRSGRTMWRQSADTSFEPVARMMQTTAAGGIVWYHHLGLDQGFRGDRRWQEPGRAFLQWQAKNEAHFHNVRSLANVAIVVPTNTLTHHHESKGKAVDYLQGMYAALVDARIPFDFVHENDMGAARLAPYDLLILPNMALMSDGQVRALEAFAGRGGSILGTYQTGLFDETGKPRADFATAGLFGIAKAGDVAVSQKGVLERFVPISLQMVRDRGALTEGFDGTEWIAGASNIQPIKPVAGAPLTVIGPYPVYPPEAVYRRKVPGDQPTMVTRTVGKARLAYMAGDVDATYWRLDNPDLGRLLGNTLRWLLDGKVPVTVSGEGLAEVFAWKTRPGYAVHLLNYNGPNAFRGHMRKPVSLGAQQMRIVLPDDARIGAARLLWADAAVPFAQNGRTVELTVPAVGPYEVVALT